jgi:hypothetical protein
MARDRSQELDQRRSELTRSLDALSESRDTALENAPSRGFRGRFGRARSRV